MKESESVKAVVKTLMLLQCLSEKKDLGLTELAKLSGMHKSTVHRFLATLNELGYVRQNPSSERYSLTLKLFELGSAVLSRMELWEEAHPIIEQLAEKTRETIHLSVMDDFKLVYLGKIESTQTLRVSMMSKIGQSAPTYCTGVGKVLLAYLKPEVTEAILDAVNFQQFTENTITDRTQLQKELDSIRRHGYAIDNEEHEVGVRCVAAPVRNNKDSVVAALSISVPSVRMPNSRASHYKDLVIEAADGISARLGAVDSKRPYMKQSGAGSRE